MNLRQIMRWRAQTPRQVVAERLVSTGAAWLVAIPVSMASHHFSTGVAFAASWTVVNLLVGIPLGLRRVRTVRR